MGNFVDLTGQRFGKLIVIRRTENRKRNRVFWLCKCECGEEKEVERDSLNSGRTQSCGCLRREVMANIKRKHGHSVSGKPSPEYSTWMHIKDRCTNPNDGSYKNYGGRGITVCERWLHSFENFLEDMGHRPSFDYSIERVNNNKGYFPDNCKWATTVEQARNQRVRRDNTSGYKGVCWSKSENKYIAYIFFDGKRKNLGYFSTIEKAVDARQKAEKKYWKSS